MQQTPKCILGSAARSDPCSKAEVGDGSPPRGELRSTVRGPLRFEGQGRRPVDDGVREGQVWGDGQPGNGRGPERGGTYDARDRCVEYAQDVYRADRVALTIERTVD